MRIVKITESAHGVDFGYSTGDEVIETQRNADFLDSVVRGGLGYYMGSEKKKVPPSPGPNENPDVLHDVPTGAGSGKQPGKTRGRGLFRHDVHEGQPARRGEEGPVPEHDDKLAQDAGDSPESKV